jgi:hypothetical protein
MAAPAIRQRYHGLDALRIERYFTKPGVDPYGTVAWERRSATIPDEEGNENAR